MLHRTELHSPPSGNLALIVILILILVVVEPPRVPLTARYSMTITSSILDVGV